MLRKFSLMDEADGQTSAGGPGADGKDGDTKTPDPAVELLTKSVSLLAQGLSELQGQNVKITETLAALSKGQEPPKKEEKTIGQEIEENSEALESMDNKQLITFLVDKLSAKFEARVKELSGEVDQKVGTISQQFHSRATSEEVQKMIDKNPDFMEWAPEMKVILREHPNMSVQRAFTLAKEENPQKKAEMIKKYAKPPSETKQKSYGLTPTSSRDTGTGKLNPREAAEKAFEEIMAGISVQDVQLS